MADQDDTNLQDLLNEAQKPTPVDEPGPTPTNKPATKPVPPPQKPPPSLFGDSDESSSDEEENEDDDSDSSESSSDDGVPPENVQAVKQLRQQLAKLSIAVYDKKLENERVQRDKNAKPKDQSKASAEFLAATTKRMQLEIRLKKLAGQSASTTTTPLASSGSSSSFAASVAAKKKADADAEAERQRRLAKKAPPPPPAKTFDPQALEAYEAIYGKRAADDLRQLLQKIDTPDFDPLAMSEQEIADTDIFAGFENRLRRGETLDELIASEEARLNGNTDMELAILEAEDRKKAALKKEQEKRDAEAKKKQEKADADANKKKGQEERDAAEKKKNADAAKKNAPPKADSKKKTKTKTASEKDAQKTTGIVESKNNFTFDVTIDASARFKLVSNEDEAAEPNLTFEAFYASAFRDAGAGEKARYTLVKPTTGGYILRVNRVERRTAFDLFTRICGPILKFWADTKPEILPDDTRKLRDMVWTEVVVPLLTAIVLGAQSAWKKYFTALEEEAQPAFKQFIDTFTQLVTWLFVKGVTGFDAVDTETAQASGERLQTLFEALQVDNGALSGLAATGKPTKNQLMKNDKPQHANIVQRGISAPLLEMAISTTSTFHVVGGKKKGESINRFMSIIDKKTKTVRFDDLATSQKDLPKNAKPKDKATKALLISPQSLLSRIFMLPVFQALWGDDVEDIEGNYEDHFEIDEVSGLIDKKVFAKIDTISPFFPYAKDGGVLRIVEKVGRAASADEPASAFVAFSFDEGLLDDDDYAAAVTLLPSKLAGEQWYAKKPLGEEDNVATKMTPFSEIIGTNEYLFVAMFASQLANIAPLYSNTGGAVPLTFKQPVSKGIRLELLTVIVGAAMFTKIAFGDTADAVGKGIVKGAAGAMTLFAAVGMHPTYTVGKAKPEYLQTAGHAYAFHTYSSLRPKFLPVSLGGRSSKNLFDDLKEKHLSDAFVQLIEFDKTQIPSVFRLLTATKGPFTVFVPSSPELFRRVPFAFDPLGTALREALLRSHIFEGVIDLESARSKSGIEARRLGTVHSVVIKADTNYSSRSGGLISIDGLIHIIYGPPHQTQNGVWYRVKDVIGYESSRALPKSLIEEQREEKRLSQLRFSLFPSALTKPSKLALVADIKNTHLTTAFVELVELGREQSTSVFALLSTKGPFTVFVPSDRELRQKVPHAFEVNATPLREQLLKLHIFEGVVDLSNTSRTKNGIFVRRPGSTQSIVITADNRYTVQSGGTIQIDGYPHTIEGPPHRVANGVWYRMTGDIIGYEVGRATSQPMTPLSYKTLEEEQAEARAKEEEMSTGLRFSFLPAALGGASSRTLLADIAKANPTFERIATGHPNISSYLDAKSTVATVFVPQLSASAENLSEDELAAQIVLNEKIDFEKLKTPKTFSAFDGDDLEIVANAGFSNSKGGSITVNGKKYTVLGKPHQASKGVWYAINRAIDAPQGQEKVSSKTKASSFPGSVDSDEEMSSGSSDDDGVDGFPQPPAEEAWDYDTERERMDTALRPGFLPRRFGGRSKYHVLQDIQYRRNLPLGLTTGFFAGLLYNAAIGNRVLPYPNTGNYTIFVPADGVLTEADAMYLRANPDTAARTLGYHIVPQIIDFSKLRANEEVGYNTQYGKEKLYLQKTDDYKEDKGGRVLINGKSIEIVGAPNQTQNGVWYLTRGKIEPPKEMTTQSELSSEEKSRFAAAREAAHEMQSTTHAFGGLARGRGKHHGGKKHGSNLLHSKYNLQMRSQAHASEHHSGSGDSDDSTKLSAVASFAKRSGIESLLSTCHATPTMASESNNATPKVMMMNPMSGRVPQRRTASGIDASDAEFAPFLALLHATRVDQRVAVANQMGLALVILAPTAATLKSQAIKAAVASMTDEEKVELIQQHILVVKYEWNGETKQELMPETLAKILKSDEEVTLATLNSDDIDFPKVNLIPKGVQSMMLAQHDANSNNNLYAVDVEIRGDNPTYDSGVGAAVTPNYVYFINTVLVPKKRGKAVGSSAVKASTSMTTTTRQQHQTTTSSTTHTSATTAKSSTASAKWTQALAESVRKINEAKAGAGLVQFISPLDDVLDNVGSADVKKQTTPAELDQQFAKLTHAITKNRYATFGEKHDASAALANLQGRLY